jgi:hypothetical protein
MIDELIDETIRRVEATEGRSRSRAEKPKVSFDHAVRHILLELWKASKCIPAGELSINKRSGYYSEQNERYRDPLLTYKQTMAAFEGLVKLGFVEITQKGYFDRESLEGGLTRIIAADELKERLDELQSNPAIAIGPDLSRETILLRNRIDGHRVLVDYEDTDNTDKYRQNLYLINSCFAKHWFDLEVLDSEIPILADRITSHSNKEPVDFSKRTLVRIFSNGSFKEGGRFYRAWWQNVPSEYRKYTTIDEKRTGEGDFSQLNPHMLYFANNKELGSEDAYDRVLDGQHRAKVKEAFNAMVQANTPLKSCPKTIDLSEVDISWTELRDRILASHKPIAHEFFNGVGNKLQFKDSAIAEKVMLHFAKIDAPALPVHDSFIIHHGYAASGEMEEAMRRAFHETFGESIKVSEEIIDWQYRKTQSDSAEIKPPSMNQILKADDDVSQWRHRHSEWYKKRSQHAK